MKKRLSKKKLLAVTFIILFIFVFLFYFVQLLIFWHNMKIYADINIPYGAKIIFVDDGITFQFLDGYYFVKYKASKEHIENLLSRTPSWTQSQWKKGRQINLAKFFDIENKEQIYSIIDKESFRILTIDKKNNVVYFELVFR